MSLSSYSFYIYNFHFVETDAKLEAAHREVKKYRTQLSGVGNFLGNYLTKQDELWAMLLLEPSLDPEESDKTVENKIWNARWVFDLLFHADKGFVSKDVSILGKKN